MKLYNDIYSTFSKLRLKLFDNIPSKINLNYFDMLYIKPFKYIPNYIILWFEKYIPNYIKNLEQLHQPKR
jgi:hypothetical protein